MKHQTVPAIVEKLLTARAKIQVGWCKGRLFKDSDCVEQYCAFGALGPFPFGHEYPLETQLLHKALPEGQNDVVRYNDHPRTTQADILALYDRAIEIALHDTMYYEKHLLSPKAS